MAYSVFALGTFLLNLWLLQPLAHDFYVSITYVQIKHKAPLSLHTRIFRNDLELAMRNYTNDQQWSFQADSAHIRQVADYLQDKLAVVIDNDKYPMMVDQVEQEGSGVTETINCHLVGKGIASIVINISISNLVLTEIYEDQVNMVHVRKEDRRRQSRNLDRYDHTFSLDAASL